jgi:hypothetical protein
MKEINVDVIPLLPYKDVIGTECVAWDVSEAGVFIHYLDRDKARLVEWQDIVEVGLKDILAVVTDAKIPREIKEPTKRK